MYRDFGVKQNLVELLLLCERVQTVVYATRLLAYRLLDDHADEPTCDGLVYEEVRLAYSAVNAALSQD